MTIISETKVYPGASFILWMRTKESITDDTVKPDILSIDKFTIGSDDNSVLMPNRAKVRLRFQTKSQAATWYQLLTAYPDRNDWAIASIRHANIADGYLMRGWIDPELISVVPFTSVLEMTIVDEHSNMSATLVEESGKNANVYDLKTLIIQELFRGNPANYGAIDFQTKVKATFAGGIESSVSGFKWLHQDLLSPVNLASSNAPIKTYGDVYRAIMGTLQSVFYIDLHSNLILFPKYYDYRDFLAISMSDIVNNSVGFRYVKRPLSAKIQYNTYFSGYQSLQLGTEDSSSEYELIMPFPCSTDDQWSGFDYSVYLSNSATFNSGLVYHDSIQFAGYSADYDTYFPPYSFKQIAQWRFERMFGTVLPDLVLSLRGLVSPAAFYKFPAELSDQIWRVKQIEYEFHKNQSKLTMEVAEPLV